MLQIRPILKEGNPKLRKKSIPVPFPLSAEDEETAQYLLDYLEYANNPSNNERPGVGLAAPQIGVNKRIVALLFVDEDKENSEKTITTPYILINPKIISHSVQKAYLHGGEGCLSVDDDREGYVERYLFVTIEAYDFINKQVVKLKMRGYRSLVIQHEIDHLDGILYLDRINQKDPYKLSEGAIAI